jgi:hypothetical protein
MKSNKMKNLKLFGSIIINAVHPNIAESFRCQQHRQYCSDTDYQSIVSYQASELAFYSKSWN